MSAPLRVERDGAVLALTFDRPDVFNALTLPMVLAAVDAVEGAARDEGVRLVTVTGAGRAFCAGADLEALQPSPDPDMAVVDAVNRFALAVRAAPQLVVALVNGPAAGVGSSFALGADLAVASDAAYLKTGFEAIGLMPDGGGSAYLTADLGRSRALAVAVLGDRIDAAEALRLGLFARVWPASEFAAESAALVARLAAGPTGAYAAAKRAVDARALPAFPAALETERREQRRLLAADDFAEGVAAFRGKRRPVFTGR